jgi:hypothetical protein
MEISIENDLEAPAEARARKLSTADLEASISHCRGLRDASRFSRRWDSYYNSLIEVYQAELARRTTCFQMDGAAEFAEAQERARLVRELAYKRWGA